MTPLSDIWVYLAASPLLHLTLTLVAYQIGLAINRAAGGRPLFNPVLIAVMLLVALLVATKTPYPTYFAGAQFVHFLLGPATVALAIPLFRQLGRLRRVWRAVVVSLFVGSAVAALSAVLIARVLGGSPQIVASLAPKSVTAPVAMAVSRELGGAPSLTAVAVIVTGVLGAMFGPILLDRLKVRDPAARGLAMGVASHGIGTARALQESETAGAFSGLAMGLNALLTSLALPLAWALLR
jgi:predicted murein hydrolase (TIGR00659 family)